MKSEPHLRKFSAGTFGSSKADLELADFLNDLKGEDGLRRKIALQRKVGKMIHNMNTDHAMLFYLSKMPVGDFKSFKRIYNVVKRDWMKRINASNFDSHLKLKLFSCLRARFKYFN